MDVRRAGRQIVHIEGDIDVKRQIRKELLFFDGGIGTLLQEKGLQPGELPEVWNLEHAEEVMEIHREYYKAGSDIVLAILLEPMH